MTLIRRRIMAALATALFAGAPPTWADEGIGLKISGYGTVGAVVTNTDESEFRSSGRQDRGATSEPDFGVDTRLGLQADVTFNEHFSGAAQALASRIDGTDKVLLEWLYGKAKVSSWLDVQVGRMVLPVFLISDSRNIGYAAHWLRAPSEVYNLFPASSFDGVQALTHASWADTKFSLQVSAGKAESTAFLFNNPVNLRLDRLRSFSLAVEKGDWTARVGRTSSFSTITGLPFPIPPGNDVFTSAGLQFDNGQWIVMSEYVTRRVDGDGGNSNSYYVSAGYRIESFTPYVTIGRFDQRGQFARDPIGKTNAAGVRWDGLKNMALKAQFETAVNGTQFINSSTAVATTFPTVKVFSVVADFVF